MFKNFFLFLMLLLGVCLPLTAQVSFISVTDEDKHTQKEDFWHTFEYYVIPAKGPVSKCQATRVGKNWFATAAHCVVDRCSEGCSLRIDLLEQPVSAFVFAQHTKTKPIVFSHPKYKSNVPVAYDFALFKMDFSRLSARYYKRPEGKEKFNTQISRASFEKYLQAHSAARREFEQVIRPHLPPILVFDNATYRIDRTLSVISIFDGVRSILHNPHPTDYVKELGYAYTQNFGVRKGMSGSGVMTNTGELAGIISAYLGVSMGKKQKEYFMFTVFNPEITAFMEKVMGSDYYKLDRKDAFPNYVTKTRANHSDVLEAVHQIQKQK